MNRRQLGDAVKQYFETFGHWPDWFILLGVLVVFGLMSYFLCKYIEGEK
jgi:hypothetical protein